MIDVFAEVRNRVSAREVAEVNGFHPNRSNFICCPLHHEKTPSLKLYQNGSWHCFGCGKGGSSIDLAVALYGLSPLDAVRQLDRDFNLCLPIDRPQTPQERTETAKAAERRRELSDTYKLFEGWKDTMLGKLTAVFRTAHLALKDCSNPDALSEAEAQAIKWQAVVEYWADCLLYGDMDAQMSIFRDRRGVEARCDRILNLMQMKSGAT